MKLIPSETVAQAWVEACQHLVSIQPSWTDTTVVLHIDKPTLIRRQDRAVADALDSFLVKHDGHPNHTVAETIFPAYEYVRGGVEGVYTAYPEEVYPLIEKHPDARHWGTYAYRLLRRKGPDGVIYNPLKECIKKMHDTNRKRAAYEVGLGFGFDLATYDDDEDRGLRMGGPCLSHLSFKLKDKKIHLAAMYRSHHYVQRAYGNLLGLARLQAFVAEQVGVESGPLVCHSTMAVLEHGTKPYGWSKDEVSSLIAQCENLMRGDAMLRVV